MATVEILESVAGTSHSLGPSLRLVSARADGQSFRRGLTIAQRREVRQQRTRRRQRVGMLLVVMAATVVLCIPGHVFGATTGAGLSGDLANSSVLASGMDYVVQPGDTVASIAVDMNPVDPSFARSLLLRELHSSVVVPGEHVLIP